MVRVSYEYGDQNKHFKGAVFLLEVIKSLKLRNHQAQSHKDCTESNIKKSDECNYDGLKQINGRYYTKEEAKVSGFNWDDY